MKTVTSLEKWLDYFNDNNQARIKFLGKGDAKKVIEEFVTKIIGDGWVANDANNIERVLRIYSREFLRYAESELDRRKIQNRDFFNSYLPEEDLKLAQAMCMIHDAFGGEFDPKVYRIENNLWSDLLTTDLDQVNIEDIKPQFDTMIIEFEKIPITYRPQVDAYTTVVERNNFSRIKVEEFHGYLDSMIITTDGINFNFYFPPIFENFSTDKNILHSLQSTPSSGPHALLPSIFVKSNEIKKINKDLDVIVQNELINGFNDIAKRLIIGYFNMLIYIAHIKPAEKIEIKKFPKIFKKREFTDFESFYVEKTLKIKNTGGVKNDENDEMKKISCPKWDVRPHYRYQSHGPNRSLRKLIWIEGFKKGIFRTIKDIPSVPRNYKI